MKRFLSLIISIFILINPAFSMDWNEAIKNVELKIKEYEEIADKRQEPCCLGTIWNEYNIPEHTCAILGRMLGKANLIKHLEEEPIKITDQDRNTVVDDLDDFSQVFMLEAHNLSNWVHTVKGLLKLDNAQKIKTWNLDCVGNLVKHKDAFINQSNQNKDAFFDLSEDKKIIYILGDINIGFAKKLINVLNKYPSIEIVALGSAGGVVVEAIEAGLEIRKRNLETVLWNNCYSACPLVFMGGIERTIWSPYPDIGLHEISKNGIAVSKNDLLYKVTYNYIKSLQIDADFVLTKMWSASPKNMIELDAQEMCDAKVVTWIQRVCW